MSSNNEWVVNDITITKHGDLVITALPGYYNRKRWEGAMQFTLPDGQLDNLLKQIEKHKSQGKVIEIAADSMQDFLGLFKAEYLEKRRTLAEQLDLGVDDIPKPFWYGFDDPNRAVEILRNRI